MKPLTAEQYEEYVDLLDFARDDINLAQRLATSGSVDRLTVAAREHLEQASQRIQQAKAVLDNLEEP